MSDHFACCLSEQNSLRLDILSNQEINQLCEGNHFHFTISSSNKTTLLEEQHIIVPNQVSGQNPLLGHATSDKQTTERACKGNTNN